MRSLPVPAAALALVTCLASPSSAATLAGHPRLIDADTVALAGQRVRILDVDAPETRQTCQEPFGAAWACGRAATAALAAWIAERPMVCDGTRLDRYGRLLAACTVAGVDVAGWLALNGWAVPYRDCGCAAVRVSADRARIARAGIWAGTFAMPWEWRKAH